MISFLKLRFTGSIHHSKINGILADIWRTRTKTHKIVPMARLRRLKVIPQCQVHLLQPSYTFLSSSLVPISGSNLILRHILSFLLYGYSLLQNAVFVGYPVVIRLEFCEGFLDGILLRFETLYFRGLLIHDAL